MKSNKTVSGFTLVELLIVMAILGVMITFVTITFSGSQKSARDANRKSDLSQYRTALEAFANQTDGLYPAHTSAVNADSLCGASELNLAIVCPVDPKTGTAPYSYRYISNGSSGITATRYALFAYLERSANYWIMCSNGTTKGKTSAAVIGDCP